MKIKEILEAIGTVGSTTEPTDQDGLPKTGSNPSSDTLQKSTQQDAQLKNSVTAIKQILQKSGGGQVDVNKLSQTLKQQGPGMQVDMVSIKSLQSMLPAISTALKNPQSATALKQALAIGQQSQQNIFSPKL